MRAVNDRCMLVGNRVARLTIPLLCLDHPISCQPVALPDSSLLQGASCHHVPSRHRHRMSASRAAFRNAHVRCHTAGAV
jgi:hypothetical protein